MKIKALVVILAMFAQVTPAQPADLLMADFEGATYGDWKVAGDAFGSAPARGALPNQMPVDGFLGKGLVNSYFKGDVSTGTLTSPPFKLERHYIKFLIGGGGFAGKTCLNLLVNGQVVRSATGPNTQPGGSERLDWRQWDVGELTGQNASLEIVDNATGGWGHINVDHIVQTDQKLPQLLTNATRRFKVEKGFLNLPVKNGAPKRWVSVLVDGRVERDFEIELADAEPDWWAFLDLGPFRDQPVLVQVDKLSEDSAALRNIHQSDKIMGSENLYRETLRPQFHFTSRRGWNNDPNGLVFHKGEYHLFYQHNPYGWDWGNMHWGHAVSRDLLRWRELGDALYPDEMGTMFSGSAVVDEHNTAGFGRGKEPAMVCVYTAAGDTSRLSKKAKFTQCLAFSIDRGRSWTKYEKNPVLPHIIGGNRDPKVIWYAPEKKWIMALYLDGNDFALFDSPNLKDWRRLSDVKIPGTSECPEFFEIPLDGDRPNTRWVFYGGNGRYLIGRFDGKTFTPESGPHSLNFGNCFYASQTYNGIPAKDGRRILVAWGQVSLPGMPFNQMMDLPVELTLRNTGDGLRLFTNPIRKIKTLWTHSQSWNNLVLRPDQNPLAGVKGELFDISADITPGNAEDITLSIRGLPLVYEVKNQVLVCRDKRAKLPLEKGRLRLRLLVDRVSVEIFANDGTIYMPMWYYPKADAPTMELKTSRGEAWAGKIDIHWLMPAKPTPTARSSSG